jgi:hypothetical protein
MAQLSAVQALMRHYVFGAFLVKQEEKMLLVEEVQILEELKAEVTVTCLGQALCYQD